MKPETIPMTSEVFSFPLPPADAEDEGPAVLDFAAEQSSACAGGWMLSRYYSDGGERVRDYLSYDSVFEICPFEVGVNRHFDRKIHRTVYAWLTRLLELADLLPRAFCSLSNGEMRRVIFARAVLRRPRRLVLVAPMAGLDPRRRSMFREAIEAVRRKGVLIEIVGESEQDSDRPREHLLPFPSRAPLLCSNAAAVIEMNGVTVRYGRRTVLKDFSWTVHEGERWILRGPNGSGKTTLLALITGDSPLAYAHDIKVFGIPREVGRDLSAVRSRIAAVSPEMQAYLGKSPEELVTDALAREPDILLLDEPCYNLSWTAARKLLARIERWLRAHPKVAAVCVAHRAPEIPRDFDRILELKGLPPRGL